MNRLDGAGSFLLGLRLLLLATTGTYALAVGLTAKEYKSSEPVLLAKPSISLSNLTIPPMQPRNQVEKLA